MNFIRVLFFVFLGAICQCSFAENYKGRASYIGFLSQEPGQELSTVPETSTIHIVPLKRTVFWGDYGIVWEKCEKGWNCIDSSILTFALKKGQVIELNKKWAYKKYSFNVINIVESKNDIHYIIEVTMSQKRIGQVVFSPGIGISSFSIIHDSLGKFDVYSLISEKGIFAKMAR